jgi:predicted enzyme related to lactoylglutathione lyase
MFLGLRTALYHAPDLAKAKAWYSKILGLQPYFDEPFYVGFNVGGYELGLDPDGKKLPAGATGVTVYWGVARVEPALEHLLANGATLHSGVQEVGGGIRVATVLDPFTNIFGVIENPHFKLPLPPKVRAKKKKKPAPVKAIAKPKAKTQAKTKSKPKPKPVKAAVAKKSRPATRRVSSQARGSKRRA